MNTIFNTTVKHGIKINSIIDRFHDMLFLAEQLFGNRNKEYTILGIEISTNDYPQRIFIHDTKSIIIQLTEEYLQDIKQAMYQTSHETVHCLDYSPGTTSNVLEEGVATWFSIYYMKEKCKESWHTNSCNYQHAMDLVSILLSYDNYSIKKLRKLESCMSKVTPELILSVVPLLDSKIAEELASPFERE